MEDYKLIFYLLTAFIVFGCNIFDNNKLNISGICFNLALLVPFIMLKIKVETASYYLNKEYQLESLTNILKTNGNLSEKEIKRYVRRIDILNDIDDDGIDMVVNQFVDFANNSGSKREIELIFKRVNIDNLKNNFKLFNLNIDKKKFEVIKNDVLKQIIN